MGENNKALRLNHHETVPTSTIGAAFTLAIIMGLIVVSGVLQKPYDAREVVENLHEKVMMQKEYRELSRISYSVAKLDKVAYSKPHSASFPESENAPAPSYAITIPTTSAKKPFQKTERAQDFDREVKSDVYWKNLQASIAGIKPSQPGSAPVVLPPVVVGSAD